MPSEGEHVRVNARNLLEERGEARLGPKHLPVPGEEDETPGRDELLQRPAAGEPLAPPEGRVAPCEALAAWDVVQVRIADLGVRIPGEHGVDGLRELGTARTVDAACVDP